MHYFCIITNSYGFLYLIQKPIKPVRETLARIACYSVENGNMTFHLKINATTLHKSCFYVDNHNT